MGINYEDSRQEIWIGELHQVCNRSLSVSHDLGDGVQRLSGMREVFCLNSLGVYILCSPSPSEETINTPIPKKHALICEGLKGYDIQLKVVP